MVGVGLIGGSFALALKQAGQVDRVIGVDRSADNLQRALALGLIDEAADDLETAVAQADLVVLATPVGQLSSVLAQMAPVLRSGTLITDVASSKGNVVEAFRRHLPAHLANCVPGHPIAGAEQSGADAAQASLFVQREVVLTPLEETRLSAIRVLTDLWQACGARVSLLSPAQHDHIFAALSHLPHLLAFSYINSLTAQAGPLACLEYASTGFRDFTRIAASSPEMWRDICLGNQHALLETLATYRQTLDQLIEEVAQGDGEALAARFSQARQSRNDWYQTFQDT